MEFKAAKANLAAVLEYPVFLIRLHVEGQPAPEVLVAVTDDILALDGHGICLSLHLCHLGIKLLLSLVFCLSFFQSSLIIAVDINMVYAVNLLHGEQLFLTTFIVYTIDVARGQQTFSFHCLGVDDKSLTIALIRPHLYLESALSRSSKLVIETCDRHT